jgi:hypothetical protein
MRRNAFVQDQYAIRQLHRAERISGNFGTPISISIALLLSFLAVQSATAQIVSMMGIDPKCSEEALQFYLYDRDEDKILTIKGNCWGIEQVLPSLAQSQTMAVYGQNDHSAAKLTFVSVYDIASGKTTDILSLFGGTTAWFDSSDRIVFQADDASLKKMDANGRNITTLAVPEEPYLFDSYFEVSPDRQKIVAFEHKWVGGHDYNTDHFTRVVLLNTDGTGRKVLLPDFLGESNLLSWKPTSDGFLFYFHIYNGLTGDQHKAYPRYFAFDLSTDPVEINDLSESDLGKEENVLFYTRCGTLLSASYPGEIYDPGTGALLDTDASVPSLWDGLWGFDDSGGIYFADPDGSSFRPFECSVFLITIDIKPGSDSNCVNLGSAGVIPVAVLSSATFDATQIDPATVSLAGASIKLVGKSDKFLAHYEDVNGDGLLDLVCQVLTEDFSIEPGETTASFEAATYDGIPVWGEDSVCIVPGE